MSGHRHSPNRLRNYFSTHETIIRQLLDGGFLTGEELSIVPVDGSLLMEGVLRCEGGIRITVDKRILILEDGDDPLVARDEYSYNVSLERLGNIFRYDSPHEHRPCHHVHRYVVLDGDTEGTVEEIWDEDATPTLGDVVREAERWYYENFERLHELGIA